MERYAEENLGKDYIKWYLSVILKIGDIQLRSIEKNDLIFAQFGKKLAESNVENTFKNYYQNEANIERLNHELKFAIMLYQAEESSRDCNPQYIEEHRQSIERISQYLKESEIEKPKIDSEFQKKEEK